MDCREFQELISEAVDNRLHKDAQQHFNSHAVLCRHCRNEFEVEQITKSVVQARLRPYAVGSDVRASVLASIHGAAPSRKNWLTAVFGEAYLNPAVALVALLLVVVGAVSVLQRNNALPISTEKNIITQSLSNYNATMAGILKPTLVSHDPGDVKEFLSKDSPFEVSVATLSGCDWCGGILSDVNGVKLAHVVYKIGGEGLLYVYQVDMNEVLHGTKVALPENAKASLAKTGWYFESTNNRCNVVLWKHKNTLCAAVSAIDRDKMVALLSEKNPW